MADLVGLAAGYWGKCVLCPQRVFDHPSSDEGVESLRDHPAARVSGPAGHADSFPRCLFSSGRSAFMLVSSLPPGTQGPLRTDGLSTLVYFANWHEILANHSYFAQVSAPSPLLHTWTLAIEEQFYLVWPIVVVCVLKLSRSPRVLFLVAVLGVLASAAEMALLFHPGSDPSRIYYGTDTRAQDILTGAALGILLYPAIASSRSARAGFSWMAVLAATVFTWEWTRINVSPNVPYRGGFLLADVMVALVICGVTLGTGQPSGSGPVRRAVDLRWTHLLRLIPMALADIPCAQRGKDWPS